jgi:hypothetical protein
MPGLRLLATSGKPAGPGVPRSAWLPATGLIVWLTGDHLVADDTSTSGGHDGSRDWAAQRRDQRLPLLDTAKGGGRRAQPRRDCLAESSLRLSITAQARLSGGCHHRQRTDL